MGGKVSSPHIFQMNRADDSESIQGGNAPRGCYINLLKIFSELKKKTTNNCRQFSFIHSYYSVLTSILISANIAAHAELNNLNLSEFRNVMYSVIVICGNNIMVNGNIEYYFEALRACMVFNLK